MRKIAIGCGILFLVGIGFVVLMFYILSMPKYRDVSKEVPFNGFVKKDITTKRETLILKYPGNPTDENYIFHLEDGTGFGLNSDLETIVALPLGTKITIDKVELHTGRVSGTTSAYLFGKVFSEATQQEYAFQYTWGDYRPLQEDRPYWMFELAFWQDEPLMEKYYIKVP